MTPEQAKQTIDTLSRQSDHWLFIAALVVLGVVIYLVARYFKKLFDDLIADHKLSREQHSEALTKICSDQNETNQKLAVVLDRNSTALTENTSELRRCRESRT